MTKTAHIDPGVLSENRLPCTSPNVGYKLSVLTVRKKVLLSNMKGKQEDPCFQEQLNILEGLKQTTLPAHLLVKHKHSDHPTEKRVTFGFNILKKFKDPLTRQAEEGVRIFNQGPSIKIFNSKSEFNHPPMSKIRIDK